MTDGEIFNDISWRIMRLANEQRLSGRSEDGRRLVEMAANVELMSSDLQNCWGGPLNGQVGRRQILRQILDRIQFDAILETGTFRGITTEWFAENFKGSIFTCEIEQLYFLQARHRMSRFPNVELQVSNSRSFLRKCLNNWPAGSSALFYLDAHWKSDLPVVDELKIIFGSEVRSVVVIDDFRVPSDAGYGYDDYGAGKALTLELLEFLKNDDFRFYFPRLASSQESGAARGVCIITKLFSSELDQCDSIRGGTWGMLRAEELASSNLHERINSIEANEASTDRSGSSSSGHVSEPVLERLIELENSRELLGRTTVRLRADNLELQRQLLRKQREIEPAQTETDRAKAETAHANAELEHVKAELEHAKAELEHAKAELEHAKAEIERAMIEHRSSLIQRVRRVLGTTERRS